MIGLSKAGWRVVGFARALSDRSPDTRPDAGETGVWAPIRWVIGPFNAEGLEQASRAEPAPSLVVHALGVGSVTTAAAFPVDAFDTTVRSTALLLDHLRRTAPTARVLYPSSAAVYGESLDTLAERSPTHPVSTYGWHKLLVETLLEEARALHGLECTAIRFFSVYGPELRKQVLWDWGRRLLAGEAPLAVSGTGEEVRDFLYVDDAVALLIWLASMPPGTVPPILNGGTGCGTSLRQLADHLASALNCRTPVLFDGRRRQGDPSCYRADTRLLSSLGFAPAVSVQDGIGRYARWLREMDGCAQGTGAISQ